MRRILDKYQSFNEAHPKAQRVFKGVAYIFSEKMLKFIIGFIVHALVARHLGPDEFGKLSYIIKTVNIFYAFSLFGVDELVLKYLLDDKFKKEDILATVFRLRLLMSCLGLFILGVFLFISRPEGSQFALLTFCYGVQIFLQAFNVFELEFQSRLSFRPLFWANNISNISASGLRVLGVFLNQGIPFFVTTYLAGDFLLKLIVQWRSGFKFLKGKFRSDVARTISKASVPHFLSAFILLADQRISYFFIEEYLKDESLGNYSVAVTLVDLWVFLPTAICATIFPTIVNAYRDNMKAYESRIQYLSDVMVWLALLFVAGVYLSADFVINLLYSGKFETAPTIIRWYSLVTIPVFFNLARVRWLSLENRLNGWLRLNLAALVLNIIFHYLLISLYGTKGTIWAYLCAQIIANVIFLILTENGKKEMKIFVNTFSFPVRIIRKVI